MVHSQDRTRLLDGTSCVGPLVFRHSWNQSERLSMLDMVHHFYFWVITFTVLAISFNSHNITLPPNGVIDLIYNIITTVQ